MRKTGASPADPNCGYRRHTYCYVKVGEAVVPVHLHGCVHGNVCFYIIFLWKHLRRGKPICQRNKISYCRVLKGISHQFVIIHTDSWHHKKIVVYWNLVSRLLQLLLPASTVLHFFLYRLLLYKLSKIGSV